MSEKQVRLSPEAMELAHNIAANESDLRSLGRTPERIRFLQGREFGPKIARLSIRDATAPYIYRPLLESVQSEQRQPTSLTRWARSTYEQNLAVSGVGNAVDRAFKD